MKSFYLRYSDIRGNLDYDGANEIDFLQKHDKAFIIEPTITERIGFKRFKSIQQVTVSRNLMFNYKKEQTHDRQVDMIISLGLSYNFLTRKKEIPIDF